jgi:UPF0176 protein
MNTRSCAIVNIAGYKFVPLDNLQDRRKALRELAGSLELKGTILVSPEGINLFLAGSRLAVDRFLATIRQDPAFHDFRVKESPGDRQPFRRLLVRIKKEIIAFGVKGIDPSHYTSRRVTPAKLREWLDGGEPVVLLDVRNDYEIELGTFRNAIPARLKTFRNFPEAVRNLPENIRDRKVVTFCTGGIRCEKAAPYLEQAGFSDVWQLDGGILQYFEDCGDVHYDGECFVFDHRVGVQPTLDEGENELCFSCQRILRPEDLESGWYVKGKSCPWCHEFSDKTIEETLERRHSRIRQVCEPLPGSLPYDNHRPLNVPQRFDGFRLGDFLEQHHPHLSAESRDEIIASGRIRLDNMALGPEDIVRAGQRLIHLIPGTVEPPVSSDIRILYEDEAIIAVQKPAPLPMHPSGRFNRNSLTWILNHVYEMPVRAVHRLDANTTGLVLFAKTARYARRLQLQFEQQTVSKRYLVKAVGTIPHGPFVIDQPLTDRPSAAGGRLPAADCESGGRQSRTGFEVLERLDDDSTLLVARPLTGRTNQIRVHLWSLGASVVGDPMYLVDGKYGEEQTLPVDAPPMCLHALSIEFEHPVTGQRITLSSVLPDWATRSAIAADFSKV